MLYNLKSYIKEKIARTDWFASQLEAAKHFEYEPYVKQLDVSGLSARFFFGTQQAREWYDPIKPYAKLEYEWVIENVRLKGQKVLDGGAHHGQYAVVFALSGGKTVAVDPYPMNCFLTEINLLLNDAEASIERCALAESEGSAHFAEQSNGRVIPIGGILVKACTLHGIMPDVEVVKLDVEGAEYSVIPSSVDKLSSVHTWIVEIHPVGNPHPDQIIRLFVDRGYEVLYVNRQVNQVEQYKLNTEWRTHSTVIARR